MEALGPKTGCPLGTDAVFADEALAFPIPGAGLPLVFWGGRSADSEVADLVRTVGVGDARVVDRPLFNLVAAGGEPRQRACRQRDDDEKCSRAQRRIYQPVGPCKESDKEVGHSSPRRHLTIARSMVRFFCEAVQRGTVLFCATTLHLLAIFGCLLPCC